MRVLVGLLLSIVFTSSAYAVSIENGQYYLLSGSIRAVDANGLVKEYTLNQGAELSYFTFDATNAQINVALHGTAADNSSSSLVIENSLFLGLGSGPGYNLTLHADASSPRFGNTYSGIGEFVPNYDPQLDTVFAINRPGQISSSNDTFKLFGAFFNDTTGALVLSADLNLTIGRNVTSEVPEPASLALLFSSLLGASRIRARRRTGEPTRQTARNLKF